MLFQEENMALVHPVFGTIRLNRKFQNVLELKAFRDLNFKTQLGTLAYSPKFLNAKHTRLMHSVGVMHLVDKMLDIISSKYPTIRILQRDREILELVALGHDIGHRAFSHSLENKSIKSHEERTIELFEAYANEINFIFGYDITSDVLKIFKDGKESYFEDSKSIDITRLVIPMLMGTIDCDRMEYLMTDRYMISGDRVDYSRILDGIAIEKVQDSYQMAFEKSVLSLIEDMLLTRVSQYENVYYSLEEIIQGTILKSYVKAKRWQEEELNSLQEFDILSDMHNTCFSGDSKSLKFVLARSLLTGNRDNFLCRKFTNQKEQENFYNTLHRFNVGENNIKVKWFNVKAYLPEEESVLIKEDGTICDLANVSLKIKDYFKEFGYVIVDLDPSYGLKPEEIQSIQKLFKK